MKKRRLLIMLAVAFLIAAALTICGDNKAASDYSDRNNWMMVPKKADKAVDVFYLYPTAWTMKEGDEPVCGIDFKPMRKRAQYVARGQATAFETVGNIYAPYYRQADASYLLSMSIEKQLACLEGIPGSDVLAAFDYYIKNYNDGRPFILAGHSQGASMTKILLFQYMKEHPDVADRMIAAYAIGYSVTKDELSANPHVKFAEGPDDVGVVISYNTEAPRIEGSNNTVLEGSIAINPISWTRSAKTVGKEKNLGSYMPQENCKYKRVEGLADATVDLERGTVVCTTVKPEDYTSPNKKYFPQGVYHSKDFGFYYYNLRQNAENRVNKYFEQKNMPKPRPTALLFPNSSAARLFPRIQTLFLFSVSIMESCLPSSSRISWSCSVSFSGSFPNSQRQYSNRRQQTKGNHCNHQTPNAAGWISKIMTVL